MTADHGVSEKCAVVDVGSRVAEALPDLRVRRIVDPMAEDRGMKEFPGAFVGLEFEDLMDEEKTRRAVKAIRSIPGVYAAIGREDALRELEMHADADCGDVVVLADASTAFSTVHTGKKVAYSYGGFDDQCVPFMLVVPPNGKKIPVEVTAKITKGNMRNYDLWPALIQCAEQTNKPT